MRSLVMVAAIGLLGCVSVPSAHLVIDASLRESMAAPVVCGPMGFRKAPLQSRWGEYVRVTVGSSANSVLRGTAFVHANGASGEPRTWTTAEGNLVIEARFENLDPDARYALLRDRPIDVTITNLEAVSGSCEGAVFTVEQGELIPNIDERLWIAELERRGGSELAERREALRIEMEARRQAHYAAWEARGATLVADAAVREAHYAAWDARRVATPSPGPAGEGWGEGQNPGANEASGIGSAGAVANVPMSGSTIIATGSADESAVAPANATISGSTSVATGSRGSTFASGSVANTTISGSAIVATGSANGSTVASGAVANTTISGSTLAAGSVGAVANTTISGSTLGAGSVGAVANPTISGSTLGAGSVGAVANTTISGSTLGAGSVGAVANTAISGSTIIASGSSGSDAVATTISGSTIATGSTGCSTCATATVITNTASDGLDSNATTASGSVYAHGVLVEAPPSSIEWTAYPAPAPATTVSVSAEWTAYPSPPPVAVSVETWPAPTQPSCDESCQAANTLGFLIPAVFEVFLSAPAPQQQPRVVKAVPLGSNR